MFTVQVFSHLFQNLWSNICNLSVLYELPNTVNVSTSQLVLTEYFLDNEIGRLKEDCLSHKYM